MNFIEYKKWTASQKCIDCGISASERSPAKPWVTETQCLECCLKHGAPENRGLPGARELAQRDGVVL